MDVTVPTFVVTPATVHYVKKDAIVPKGIVITSQDVQIQVQSLLLVSAVPN